MRQRKVFFFRSLQGIKFPPKIVIFTAEKYKLSADFVTFSFYV